ncbi:hypothetical protein WOLCODRAFT_29116 [Wolfiporia cocos MD-104 SS10]|uniref:MARVEL domain-containing protein n=1 Tax=Wolfiporia cocos (strain MD-104) TaxID=742152 RepID=A0A2H3JCB6_WOLCO|nr:hypothetical protein WOLCODRAFT_29116 [Wolfiporia cocos MD-104 SS10]
MILRAYNYNLRPVVFVVALISAIWALLTKINSFQTLNVDKQQGFPKLGSFAIILGIIYAAICGIESFGMVAAGMQRLQMARMYAILSVISGLAIVGAGFMRVILHFILKHDLISECEQIAKGDVVVEQYGFWGPTFEDRLTASQAESYCNDYWKHDSFAEIISLIVEIVVALFFSTIAFAYYRQLSDPTSVANLARAPPSAQYAAPGDAPSGEYPTHYNPPYLNYDAGYAPPPGPPPMKDPYAEESYAEGDDPYSKSVKDYDTEDPYGGAKPPVYSEDDLGTYGYGHGSGEAKKPKTEDPFSDFDQHEESTS